MCKTSVQNTIKHYGEKLKMWVKCERNSMLLNCNTQYFKCQFPLK